MNTFAPRLDILPAPQRILWPELAMVPRRFILYGGTAIALRLGHRSSADFDFFASIPFAPADLVREIEWLNQFNPMISLKALSYFGDGDLPQLPLAVQEALRRQAADLKEVARLKRRSDSLSPLE